MEVDKESEGSDADKPAALQRCGCSDDFTAWHLVIALAVAMVTVVEAAVPHSYGTWMAALKGQYSHTPVSVLNWVGTVTSALPCLLLPLFTPLAAIANRYSIPITIGSFLVMSMSLAVSSTLQLPAYLFLSYSFVYGLSSSAVLAVCICILSDYFPVGHSQHVFATSLYQIGYPIAACVFNPVLAQLIGELRWRDSIRIMAVFVLICGIGCSLLLKPVSMDGARYCSIRRRHSSSESSMTSVEISSVDSVTSDPAGKVSTFNCFTLAYLRSNPLVILWFFAKFINYVCWFALRNNLVMYLVSVGFKLQQASFAMTVYAIGEIALALCSAIFGRFLKNRLLWVHLVAASGMAILSVTWPFLLVNYSVALAMCFLNGVFVQLSLNMGYATSAEVTGLNMVSSWSLTLVAGGVGILASPLISGFVFDITQSYAWYFYLESILWSIQGIFYLILLISRYFNCCIFAPPDYEEMY